MVYGKIKTKGYYKEKAWLKICSWPDCGVEYRLAGTRYCYKHRKIMETRRRKAWLASLSPEQLAIYRSKSLANAAVYYKTHVEQHRAAALASYHRRKPKTWNGKW